MAQQETICYSVAKVAGNADTREKEPALTEGELRFLRLYSKRIRANLGGDLVVSRNILDKIDAVQLLTDLPNPEQRKRTPFTSRYLFEQVAPNETGTFKPSSPAHLLYGKSIAWYDEGSLISARVSITVLDGTWVALGAALRYGMLPPKDRTMMHVMDRIGETDNEPMRLRQNLAYHLHKIHGGLLAAIDILRQPERMYDESAAPGKMVNFFADAPPRFN